MSGKPGDPCQVTATPLENGGVYVEVFVPTYGHEATKVTLTVERSKDGDWVVFIPWPDDFEQNGFDEPVTITLGGRDGYEVCNGILYLGAPDAEYEESADG